MSAGMAEVIAEHSVTDSGLTEDRDVYWRCYCGTLYVTALTQVREHIYEHAAHVAEELAKAGYGDVPAALLAAADEMPIETLAGADNASVWLRHRAHSQDPEGHALVKAIHDRKASE